MLTRFAPYGLRSDAMADTAPDTEARIRARLVCRVDDDDKPGDDGKFSLTKEALDKRIERAKAAGVKAMLADLGAESVDAIKAKLAPPKADPPKDPAKAESPAFDAAAFKADLLKDVATNVKAIFAGTLDERAAAEKKARDDAEAVRIADQAVVDAAKAAGVNPDTMPAAIAMARALSKDGGKTLDFAALVAAHPTLKGTAERPADNGNNGDKKPKADGEKPPFDATKATPVEIAAYRDELRRKAQTKAA